MPVEMGRQGQVVLLLIRRSRGYKALIGENRGRFSLRGKVVPLGTEDDPELFPSLPESSEN